MSETSRVLVVGATGGTGRATVARLSAAAARTSDRVGATGAVSG